MWARECLGVDKLQSTDMSSKPRHRIFLIVFATLTSKPKLCLRQSMNTVNDRCVVWPPAAFYGSSSPFIEGERIVDCTDKRNEETGLDFKEIKNEIDDNTPLNEEWRDATNVSEIFFEISFLFVFRLKTSQKQSFKYNLDSLLCIFWYFFFFISFLHRQISEKFIYSKFLLLRLSSFFWKFFFLLSKTRKGPD